MDHLGAIKSETMFLVCLKLEPRTNRPHSDCSLMLREPEYRPNASPAAVH